MGTVNFGLIIKWPGREALQLSSSANIQNVWSCASTPPLSLQGVVLDKTQRKFTITFTFIQQVTFGVIMSRENLET